MRIGVSGGGADIGRTVQQAVEAEEAGFRSVWYPGATGGDPLVAMTLVGRATTEIELGTAVLQTYPVHPVVLAQRAGAVVAATGRPFTLGIGPSHAPFVEHVLGMSYDHPGRHTEEYVAVLTALLRGEQVDHEGVELTVHAPGVSTVAPVSVLLAALAPRMLRVAGQHTDGTILWLANATAIADHVVPRITAAAAQAGRPAPRVVAGVPVAVHDDVAEARAAAAEQFRVYATLPNYQRILAYGGVSTPAEAVIVGDEDAVTRQLRALFAAGATDVWTPPFPVGDDRAGSRRRTRALLEALAKEG